MDRNPYAAHTVSSDTPTPGTVPMTRYGVLCCLALLAIITAYGLLSRLTGIPTGPYIGVGGLLISVQLAAGRFVRTHRRVMSRIELHRYALTCAVAFWVLDEVPVLIRRFLTASVEVSFVVWTTIVGSAFDVALAAAIVYVTVPAMARYSVGQTSLAGSCE